MNREQLKAKAIEMLNLSDTQYSLDSQRNCILAAQVYATLATLPDETVATVADPWADAPTSIQ